MEDAYLVLSKLTKTYPNQPRPAVRDVDIDVARGEFISLLGPSGCGKTTTLRMIAGLIVPTSGGIRVGRVDMTNRPVHKRDMGMVFQSYALFPHMSVGENVDFGLQMRRIPKSERRRRVAEALDMVHLTHLANRRVSQLSGGQAQRIALARALVIEPTVLLLDEPLSNLDAKLREELRVEIRRIQQETGITTVFVTHDQDEALAMSDRLVVMSEGRVEQVGEPWAVYETPRNRFVADFIGRTNLFDGLAVGRDDGLLRVAVEGLGTLSVRTPETGRTSVTVMVRPHRVQLEPVEQLANELKGRVVQSSYLGDVESVVVEVDGVRITAERTHSGRPLALGAEVRLGWGDTDAYVIPQ
ncbi:Spermidine/putrescine import ATP-binding protein PotA [Micromonospora sp. MW-13]|uniref:ABC transporter ATP-binding protein n=1 Tax=Micromonospora sp. MW-13 TaxID=2094022 RepID=UPI000E450EC3|nr:ABC transporter ATP-binding protein [Micromonospora sp. MW-13]RGC66809.1 Spermidine/putrescine import ATP-binding protein PotA [Micromonospora sp. MW-13]